MEALQGAGHTVKATHASDRLDHLMLRDDVGRPVLYYAVRSVRSSIITENIQFFFYFVAKSAQGSNETFGF